METKIDRARKLVRSMASTPFGHLDTEALAVIRDLCIATDKMGDMASEYGQPKVIHAQIGLTEYLPKFAALGMTFKAVAMLCDEEIQAHQEVQQ